MKRFGRGVARYAALLAAIVLAGMAAEYLAGLLPQERVMANYQKSMEQLNEEGMQPSVLNIYRADSLLNNYTETLILHHSAAMNTRADASVVLTNEAAMPLNTSYPGAYYEAAASETSEPYYYTRYWMGFRAVVRPLLYLCDYAEIRRVLLWAFTALACGCLLALYWRTGRAWASLTFALALLVMNPIVVSTSFQFGCCFFLGMAGLLAALRVRRAGAYPYLLFALGALTQFFDFYTAPSVTLLYPLMGMLALLAMDASVRPSRALGLALGCVLSWLVAYAGMWLIKLMLTTWLTEEEAFSLAFNQFQSRVGLIRTIRLEEFYDVPAALKECFAVLGKRNLAALLLAFGAGAIATLRVRPGRDALAMGGIALLLACVPVAWIAVAAQPSYLHSYFQYRTLGGACLALLYAPLLARLRAGAARPV